MSAGAAAGGGGGGPYYRWANKVTIPWQSLSRWVYPRTIDEVLGWAEELWLHHGLYSQAIKKAVRYFMTDLEIYHDEPDFDYSTAEKYKRTLEDYFDLKEDAATVGDDFIAFGNSFTSLYVPFTRYLSCQDCGFSAPLKKMLEENRVTWARFTFTGACPSCNRAGDFVRTDLIDRDNAKPHINRWPPQYMILAEHEISGRKRYFLDVPRYQGLRDSIMRGDPLYLVDTPWEYIEAVRDNSKIEFAEGMVYHMVQPQSALAQPTLKGWGLPLFMNEFETAVLVHLLDKYVEAIAVDYLIPFRVISPAQKTGAGDPLVNMDMGNFMSQMRTMIDQHRNNPTTWHTAPCPIEYQALGGEAAQLIPVDLLKHFESRLLQSMGVPEEFYKMGGGGGAGTGPVLGFKIFEREWQFFADQLNKWLTWLTNKVGEQLTWEKVKVRLVPTSVHEDAETRQVKLELAAGGKISETTALRSYSIDWRYEQKLISQEQEEQQKRIEEQTKDMEGQAANKAFVQTPPVGQQLMEQEQMAAMAAQGGDPAAAGGGAVQPPPGGAGMAPPPPGANIGAGATLDDMQGEAEAQAQQILTMDPSTRRSTLTSLKKTNPTLHAMVKQMLTDMEQQGKQMGVQQIRQPQV